MNRSIVYRWPLRRRLVVVMLAVVTVVLLTTATGFMTVVFRALYTEVDDRLHDAGQAVAARYPFPDSATGPAPVFTDLTIEVVDADGTVLRVLQRQNRVGPGTPAAADAARAVRTRVPVTADGPGQAWRLLAAPLPDGTWLVVAQPVTSLRGLHNHLILVWVTAVAVILLVTVSLTTHLVGYGLRPLTRIARTAEHIETGDLSRRLPVHSRDEVGQVAGALNRMLDRIETSFAQRQAVEERLRRFVHDAGHELRTPVTAIRGWADLYRGGGVTDADLPTAMRRIADEARRIGVLIDDLLLLASLDKPDGSAGRGGTGSVVRRPVDLAEIVRDAALDAQAVEPDRPLTTQLPAPGVAMVHGDPTALHQVVANLLGNVRAHTPAGTEARLHLQRVSAGGGERVVLRVADDGPGVPAPLRDRVFDRFFRAAPGRKNQGAVADGTGAGLGLSIVSAIVTSHGGDIRAEPVTTGFAVRISLPAVP